MALPVVDAEYLKQIDKARRYLRALIAQRNCAPIMLRLAWHDAGTYDCKTKTGGPNGFIRNEEEYTHGANNGLKIALDFCEQVKAKYPKITYADLYQLAGVVAVEVTGGPTIDFVPDRKILRFPRKKGDFQMQNKARHILRMSSIEWVPLTRILVHYQERTLWEGHILRDRILMPVD
uniref:Plant heme peroxidase family profile domain-containing protein n=1 Tax=Kalanchoe fedtschenkoi TaxID=63787 RepID=A0A7N0U6D4_KALFE